ncbi:MAG: 50S ribosomal protein L6 [Nanoarchaeota archaeon]
MKKGYENSIKIPQGIKCSVLGKELQCTKGNTKLSKTLLNAEMEISLSDDTIFVKCPKSTRKIVANINSCIAHIKNMFHGLNERFVYEMEVSNVHFPMTVKLDKGSLIISNFLGEKVPRSAKILEDVEVKIEGSKIIVSSADIEKAGQTAANIEKAALVTKKDRRVFQDGIFITKKPGADI